MNDKAKKAARRAELEYVLTKEWWEYRQDVGSTESFEEWLERQVASKSSWWSEEAIELIALYDEA